NRAREAAQPRAAAILYLELETASATQSIDWWRAEESNARIHHRSELLAQSRRDPGGTQFFMPRALSKGLENDKHAADVADVGGQQRGIARHVDGVRDAFGLSRHLAETLNDRVGSAQARPVGKLGIEHQVTLILIGNESLGHNTHALDSQEDEA